MFQVKIILMLMCICVIFGAIQFSHITEELDNSFRLCFKAGLRYADDEAFKTYVHFAKDMKSEQAKIRKQMKEKKEASIFDVVD